MHIRMHEPKVEKGWSGSCPWVLLWSDSALVKSDPGSHCMDQMLQAYPKHPLSNTYTAIKVQFLRRMKGAKATSYGNLGQMSPFSSAFPRFGGRCTSISQNTTAGLIIWNLHTGDSRSCLRSGTHSAYVWLGWRFWYQDIFRLTQISTFNHVKTNCIESIQMLERLLNSLSLLLIVYDSISLTFCLISWFPSC